MGWLGNSIDLETSSLGLRCFLSKCRVVAVERLPVLHHSVDYICIFFGIIWLIVVSLKMEFCSCMFVRLSLLTMTNPNQLCDVLLFVCSKVADKTNLSSKLPVADKTSEV